MAKATRMGLRNWPSTRDGWLESVLFGLLGLVIGRLLDAGDPLLLHQPFPWLLLIPLLVALRYALLPGMLSLGILASALWWHPYPELAIGEFFAGALLMVWMASEFASAWNYRERGRTLQAEITRNRLQQLSDDLHVAQISLDRLEQSLLYKPVSVRSVLVELQAELQGIPGGQLTPEIGSRLLYFLNQLAGVQCASLFFLDPKHGRPALLASFGPAQAWQAQDVVLRHALAHGASQSLGGLDLTQVQQYLSVHYYQRQDGGVYCLCLEDLSFFAINAENLQVIEVLFQYLARYAEAVTAATEVLRRWPDCPAPFAQELESLSHFQDRVPHAGVVIRYRLPANAQGEAIVARLPSLRRGLDTLWVHRQTNQILVLALLPFAGVTAAEGQYARIERELGRHNGTHPEEWLADHRFFLLEAVPAAAQLQRILEAP